MTRPDRRRLLLAMGGALAAPAGAAAKTPLLRVDPGRLKETLQRLSEIGRPKGGDFSAGVDRFAYSDADIAGRAFAMDLFSRLGLPPRVDAAGNIHARREGTTAGLKPIMIGSHIDSVPGGGNFDGALGSMAAIEILRTLKDREVALRHPIEAVLWSNEEGGTIGSGLAAGVLPQSVLDGVMNGIRRRDGLRRIGGDPDRLLDARLPVGSIEAYLELHIEQSGSLERAGVKIGVVDGIVAIDEYEVEIRGAANHAGTTPMADRRNALLAAAGVIEAVQEEVTREPGRQVGTVGRLEVYPNVRNVVPGRVVHSLELRDLDANKIRRIAARIQDRAQAIAARTDVEITLTAVEHDEAALADPVIQKGIEAAAADLGLSVMHLPSGAGHDAAPLSRIGPMGMIFVPSVGGISHSPRELTSWEDCANGADTLLGAILRLDRA